MSHELDITVQTAFPKSVRYLALDPSQAAGAGLRLTEAPTVTSAGCSGEPQPVKLPLLLLVDGFHPRSQQQSLSLFGGDGLKEASILQVRVADAELSFFLSNLVHGEPVRFVEAHSSAHDQLKPTQQLK